MFDLLNSVYLIVIEKIQEARPKDVVWGLFAFSALVFSWILFFANRTLQRRHERRMRALRVDDKRVRSVFFDMTGNILRSQPLPKFSLEDWDLSLRELIRDWNRAQQDSPIIVPANKEDEEAFEDLMHTEASEILLQSLSGIRGFLQRDQIINEDGFRHVRFLVSLARPPKDQITWFDAARLVITPIDTARRLATVANIEEIPSRLHGKDRMAWLAVLRQMGLIYLKSQSKTDDHRSMRGIVIVDVAFEH